MKKNKKQLGFVIVCALFVCTPFLAFYPNPVFSAESTYMYFAGGETTAVGSVFTTEVMIDTEEPVNALDVEITYPADKLKFLRANDAGSIVSIWQSKPAVRTPGTIQLTGGMFKPFQGKGGRITSLSFRVETLGEATLSFSKHNIYAADGKGTEVFASSLPSVVALVEKGSSVPDTRETAVAGAHIVDDTLPSVVMNRIQDPITHTYLLAFDAADHESGIRETQLRFKKWWRYSPWYTVENPVVYPSGAWRVELRAISNAGLVQTASLSVPTELYKKLLLSALALVVLAVLLRAITRFYNKKKRMT